MQPQHVTHTHTAVSPNTLTHLQFYVRLSSLDFIEVATTNAICAPPPPPHPARHFLWLISVIACGLHRLVKIFLLAHGRSVCSPILSALLSMLYYLQHSLNVASTLRIRNVSITWPKVTLSMRVARVLTCRNTFHFVIFVFGGNFVIGCR